ncbi:hypothetical protein Mapa_013160 [Marchantia paleacea]|nr:hypothetical protein Mapa_013160 [Marchantia paleacea]
MFHACNIGFTLLIPRDTTVTATTSPTKFLVDVAESNLEPDSYLPFGSGYRARRERRLQG